MGRSVWIKGRALDALPQNIQERFRKKLNKIAELDDPGIHGSMTKLVMTGEYRMRVGAYRALVEVTDNTLIVYEASHRKGIYK